MSRDTELNFFLLGRHVISCFVLISSFATAAAVSGKEEKNFYIVYLGEISPETREFAARAHTDVLSTLKGSEDEARDSLVYSYTKIFNAFAAKLSADEAEELSEMEEVVSVFPNRYRQLHTTKSWDFIGFPQNARRSLEVESEVIVGLIDTGITPESESFSDKGFGPPPTKWKGTCGRFANFSGCNKEFLGPIKLEKMFEVGERKRDLSFTRSSKRYGGDVVFGRFMALIS